MSKVGTCLSTTKTSVLGLLLAVFMGFVFSSCEKNDELTLQAKEINAVSAENITPDATLRSLPFTPNPSSFDEFYQVDLSSYEHVYQKGVLGMCGPASYVSARSIRNYTQADFSEASNIRRQLDKKYGVKQDKTGNWGVYQLFGYQDGTDKDFERWIAGNKLWGWQRDSCKSWIKTKISQGRPCLVSCLFPMSSDTRRLGHFYIIVELYLKDGGTGSIVGVKDVWNQSDETFYYNYTDLLSSMWYNSQKYSGKGSESYAVMSFE